MHGKAEPAGRGTGRQATKEQMRVALATQDVGDEDRYRVQRMIKEIIETTRCSQSEAELALHDASNNVELAVNNIFENANLDTWTHYKKKGPKGKDEREEPVKKGGNRPDRRGGNKRDFQSKGVRGTENGTEGRENRQPRNKEDGENRGGRKQQDRPRREPNAVKRDGKKPNAEHKEEEDEHWKNGPLVFNRRENLEEKDSHSVEPSTTIKPISQPTAAGPLSFADVVRKSAQKPQPPPPTVTESPFKQLQVGNETKPAPVSPHSLTNADALQVDENSGFLAEVSKSPRQPSHHLDGNLLHEAAAPATFGNQPSPQKLQQSLTEQLKNDLGLGDSFGSSTSKKYHDPLHQNKASTVKAGVVEFLSSNAPPASSGEWQFGFEAAQPPQNTVAEDFRREPPKVSEPTRNEIGLVSSNLNEPNSSRGNVNVSTVLNQYAQQQPSSQPSYSHQQPFNRNRNTANNLPFNNYTENFNTDLRSNYSGAPSSPPKTQPVQPQQSHHHHQQFPPAAQLPYPSYPYFNMYSPVAGLREDFAPMLPFQNNLYQMGLDALTMMPQLANATSAGPLPNNQGQHHQNSHPQQQSVQQGLQHNQSSQNQQNQRNDHYSDNLFLNKQMSIPPASQNNGSNHSQQNNSNLGNNQQRQPSLMDNNSQGSVAPPPGFNNLGNAPFIPQRNLFPSMLPGLLREENALSLNDRKRKKDPKDNKRKDALAPSMDRIPLPIVPASVVETRRQLQREAQKKAKISPTNPPHICMYTILNSNGVCSATFSENLEALAIGYSNSSIQLHALGMKAFRQLKSAEELEALDSEYEEISEAMYDESSKAETIELSGHLSSVHSVCFSCDTRLLLSGSRDETVRLWNLDLRRNIVIYRADAPVWDAQFCNRGLYFASATASKTVSLYSTERIHPLRIFTDATEDVTCVDFHPNCNYVVGGSDDNNIYVWDVLTGSAVHVYSGHKSFVHSVKVSPDGRTLISASADGTLCVWDTVQQKLMAVQECDSMPFKVPIVFSRDSSVVAVGTPEHAVTFFNVDTVVSNFNGSESRNNPDGFPMLSYPTKKTNFLDLNFSRRNTVVGVGVFDQ